MGMARKQAKRVKYKRKLSQRTLEARARSGTILGERYRWLRATCRDLPRTGFLARTEIIQAGYMEIQSLKAKVRYLHGQLESGGIQAPRLPGLGRAVSLLPSATSGSCGYHQEQEGSPHGARDRGGSQLLQPDSSQIAEARGGSQLLQPDSLQITEVRGGRGSDVPAEGSPHSAYTWGGRRQEGQETGQHTEVASQPEVVVIWQGAARQPAQPAYTSTRPFLAGSPPLEERSWVPTSTEVSWRPRQEKFNLFSSTLERISSPSAEMTMVSPISLRIPVPEDRLPRTRWTPNTSAEATREGVSTYPMDLTCPRKPLEDILRNCLMRTSPLTSTRTTSTWPTSSSPGSSSNREPSTCPLPGDSFLHLPVSEIVSSLRTPERTTATDSDSRSNRPRDRLLNTPVSTPARSTTSTDAGVLDARSGMTASASTMTDLLSPMEILKWPLSPSTMGAPMLSPLGSPGQMSFPRVLTSSSTGSTATSTGTLRVARWVEDFEAERRRTGDKYSSIEGTEVDINIVRETEVDDINLVRETEVDIDLVRETGVDINTVRETEVNINAVRETEVRIYETEIQAASRDTETETVITETGGKETNNITVEAKESVVISDEEQRETINLEIQDKETTKTIKEAGPAELVTEPKSPTESAVGEYVKSDSEPEMESKSEDKPEKDEYQEELRNETIEEKDISLKDEIKSEKTDRDLELKKKVGDTKVQPKKIVAWPKHIHRDECNSDEEDTLPWSPPPLSPKNYILASTIPWIDVLSRSDAKRANSIEKLPLFGSDSEQEGESIEAIKVKFKNAYVAIRKLKLPGLRFAVKTSKKKRKKRIKQPKTRWIVNPDSKDEDWTPSLARRMPRLPAKIKLVKRRPVSEAEGDDLWQENNFNNHRLQPQRNKRLSLFLGKKLETKEERRRRKWEGTDEQHQLELMKFYKDLQEIEIKEKAKREEEMLGAKTGVSVIAIHGSKEELGKELNDEIVSEVRGGEASLRPPSLRPPASGDRRDCQDRWTLACHNPDEPKSCEIDFKKEDSNTSKDGLMERSRVVSTTEMEESMEDGLEAKATEGSKRETRAEATQTEETKVGQGEEEDSGGKEGAAGEEKVGGRGGTAGEGGEPRSMPNRGPEMLAPWIIPSDDKEVEEIEAKRPSAITANKSTVGWQEVGELQILPQKEGDEGPDPAATLCAPLSSSSPPTPYICDPCRLLQRRVCGGSERPCVRDRARPQDEVQQSQPDAEVRRGLSLR